ncbi:hypothetical protein EVAR_34267_1 [Eumeta japonica]|uniref:Uncharacterized protein n=1 Tax=Eumeta variegata TaxID=151549 RepID=A0A4C1VWZ9_EUMVA|nr:hypothetical protein EVAR_34267_1 [Eumeta japonica]
MLQKQELILRLPSTEESKTMSKEFEWHDKYVKIGANSGVHILSTKGSFETTRLVDVEKKIRLFKVRTKTPM